MRSLLNRPRILSEASITATLTFEETGYIARVVITDPWLPEDIRGLRWAGLGYLNTTSHKLYVMFHVQTTKIPVGLLQSYDSPLFQHPNTGHIAVVGGNRSCMAMAKLIFQLAHFYRVQFFDSEAAGMAYLHTQIAKDKEREQITQFFYR